METKRIVIIGASSGIGRKIATDFAAKGWSVGVAARRVDILNDLCREYPGKIVAEKIDVAEDDAVDKFQTLINRCGGMDVILYCAGTGWYNPELDTAKEERTIDVNVKGFTKIVTAAFSYFAKHGKGQIAAITSVAGTKGLAVAPAYSASKRYQWNYLQAIEQLAHSRKLKIDITDIRPGFMDTALLSSDPQQSRLPMIMSVDYATRQIEQAIIKRRRIATIDWRWRILCSLWRRVPNCVWKHISALL